MKSRNAKPLTTSATGAALAFSSQPISVELCRCHIASALSLCLPSSSFPASPLQVCSSFLCWSTAVCYIMSLRGRHRVNLFSTNTAASRQ
jgi:hypothetical protein